MKKIDDISKKISDEKYYPYDFSICTLVNDKNLYQEMLNSFLDHGFNQQNSEFLYLDNHISNDYECYGGLNKLIAHACGKYIILCHQDIIIQQPIEKLYDRLNALSKYDKNWGLAGNAGAKEHGKGLALHLIDPLGDWDSEATYPCQTQSLDGNFMILRADALLGFSHDLSGFHFYDLDIAIHARMRGLNVYVIDYKLHHKGRGTVDHHFHDTRKTIEKSFFQKLQRHRYRTTCAKVLISSSYILHFLWWIRNTRRALRLKINSSFKKKKN